MKHPGQTVGMILGGLALGLALGLLFAWLIAPVKYVDTAPGSLRADFKDQFRIMIAAAHAANGNLPRAQVRLALLGDPDPAGSLLEQSRRTGGQAALALAGLAQAIAPAAVSEPSQTPTIPATETPAPGQHASPTLSRSPTAGTPGGTQATPTETRTPRSASTPRPTATSTPTPGAPFALVAREAVCDEEIQLGLVQVRVSDADGHPVAGAEILIAWQGGQESFFTGLKPELGDGYADFVMRQGVVYALRLALDSETAGDLSIPTCQTVDGSAYGGGISLEFEQP